MIFLSVISLKTRKRAYLFRRNVRNRSKETCETLYSIYIPDQRDEKNRFRRVRPSVSHDRQRFWETIRVADRTLLNSFLIPPLSPSQSPLKWVVKKINFMLETILHNKSWKKNTTKLHYYFPKKSLRNCVFEISKCP